MTSKGKGRASTSTLTGNDGGGIALTVTPTASAFFSGEPLVFELKFTNTRPPRPSTSGSNTPYGGPSSSYPSGISLHHARNLSSSVAAASSAPASRSQFPSPLPTPTPSPARSYVDLNATNSSGTSSHIVLPERRGVVGTPLALSASTPSVSPSQSRKQFQHQYQQSLSAVHSPVRTLQQQQQQQQSNSLYSQKRIPNGRHKKNDYSVAVHDGVMASAEEDEEEGGVSDLSSQLAGMALLQERETSIEPEDAAIDAQPFVEQYKRQGDVLTGRIPSNGRRIPSTFSTINEEGGPSDSPPKRFSPIRSLSYSSATSAATSTTRIPSASSAFDALDYEYTPRTSTDFYGLSRNDSVDSVLRDSMTNYTASSGRPPIATRHTSKQHHLPSLKPPGPHNRSYSAASSLAHSAPLRPLSASSSHHQEEDHGTETLLWAFAQFTGSFTVEEALVKNGEFVAVKRGLFGGQKAPGFQLGSSGGEPVIGGGSLDASRDESDPSQGTVSGRLASWIWGSSSSSGKSVSQTDARRPSSGTTLADPVLDGSAIRRKASSAGIQAQMSSTAPSVGSLEDRRNKAMSDNSFPVFNSPPSILAVDLVLEPGESKTYTFTLQLPGDLPPSFRGKAISFSYSLMVGTNRLPNRGLGEHKQQSRFVRVPVRVYNNVSVTGVRPFYDLTNPIVWYRDEAKITSSDDTEPAPSPSSSQKHSRQRSSSIETAYAAVRKQERKLDFQEYATKLLEASFLSPSISPHDEKSERRSSRSSPVPEIDRNSLYTDGGPSARPELMKRTTSASSHAIANGAALGNDGEDTSCKSAVEIVSRNAQKVSYDINKDGYLIATLTLVKSAYRLGDTVNAMITLNSGNARVLRLAARLETHELIETTVSIKTASQVRQLTRRLHAEHHETTLDSGRVSFALAIPSGATPDFATSGVKLQWSLRVSFLILPPQQSRYSPASEDMAHPQHSRTQSILPPRTSHSASPSSAASPLRQSHGKSKSFAFSGNSSPSTPVPVETGSHHLLPVPPVSAEQQYTSFRAVPDLAFVPTLFQSPDAQAQGGSQSKLDEAVVLMPTKIETVEIAIPLRVYPSATPFRAPTSSFRV